MNDKRQLEEWDDQTEKTQSVQRTGTENRGSEGGNERSMKKKKGGCVLTCENHYSNSNSNTTFLLK